METYIAKTFDIPELVGISAKNIEEHLKLYAGYIKFTNYILSEMKELLKDADKNAYTIGELNRRFSFEFNGMRNHEYYFSSLSGGPKELNNESSLKKQIERDFESIDAFLNRFKSVAMTRGVGWAMLYYDKQNQNLITSWVDEQHLGQLNGCSPILCLDMWEHAYVYDWATSEKKKYIEAFFENLNWSVIEKNFIEAQ